MQSNRKNICHVKSFDKGCATGAANKKYEFLKAQLRQVQTNPEKKWKECKDDFQIDYLAQIYKQVEENQIHRKKGKKIMLFSRNGKSLQKKTYCRYYGSAKAGKMETKDHISKSSPEKYYVVQDYDSEDNSDCVNEEENSKRIFGK